MQCNKKYRTVLINSSYVHKRTCLVLVVSYDEYIAGWTRQGMVVDLPLG